jgi:isocitrate dehydrogenase kinase/phosphatase
LRVVERAEMVNAVFYRGQGAYLVGRLFSGTHLIPIVFALLNIAQGVVVDAVLLNENDISVLFSFTRSYFHVEIERPYDLVRFLKTIMPRKRSADIYISIGYNKQGKTELYRDLLRHLASSRDRFEIAPGARGMVMAVFAMPAYDMVFKVIKDEFSPPKETTREAVKAKYHLVFKHDRAGRLVDAQEFEHLKFERWRFSGALLAELQNLAGETVAVDENHVVIKHLYVERQVIPLNIYLREADEVAARAAVVDYGQAVKDLAASGIFPGDLLLKNFGVTRHGRVVFYDYDELCLLNECNFRALPPSRTYEEEISAEPWFSVRDNDIFPEEFERFLGLQGTLREVFLAHHADLFDPHFWQQHQKRLDAGEVIHIFPYDQDKRLFKKTSQQ